jgi:hypothetical protein
LFISFFVQTNTLGDPTIIGGKAIEVLNTILKGFILSLAVSIRGMDRSPAQKAVR